MKGKLLLMLNEQLRSVEKIQSRASEMQTCSTFKIRRGIRNIDIHSQPLEK